MKRTYAGKVALKGCRQFGADTRLQASNLVGATPLKAKTEVA